MGTVLVGMARLRLCWWPPEEDISRSIVLGGRVGGRQGSPGAAEGKLGWGRTEEKKRSRRAGRQRGAGGRRGGGGDAGFLRGRAGVEATASPAPGHFSFRHRLHRHLLPRPPPAAGNEGLVRRRKAAQAGQGRVRRRGRGGDTHPPAGHVAAFSAGLKRNVFGSEEREREACSAPSVRGSGGCVTARGI